MNRGKLIVLEGIDGSGKTTNIPIITKTLAEINIPCMAVREPGGTELGGVIRKLVKTKNHDMSPEVQVLLFATARLHLLEKVIRPAIDNGITVICDRFWGSTFAYQGGGMGVDLFDIAELANLFGFDNEYPALQLYFRIPFKVAKNRLCNDKDYFDSLGEGFFTKVIQKYEHASIHDKTVKIINANQNKELVAAEVRKTILSYFTKIDN